MKTPSANKQVKKYPFIACRPSKPTETRLRRVAKLTGRTVSAVMCICLDRELPKMELAETEKKAA
jgi:hypothetical protein